MGWAWGDLGETAPSRLANAAHGFGFAGTSHLDFPTSPCRSPVPGMRTENLAVMLTDMKGFTAATSRQTREENARTAGAAGRAHPPRGAGLRRGPGEDHRRRLPGPLRLAHRRRCSAGWRCRIGSGTTTGGPPEASGSRSGWCSRSVRCGWSGRPGGRRDVYGEAVNLAARVEAEAEAGEIWFTEAVRLVSDPGQIQADEVGLRSLKGFLEPVRLFRVARAGSGLDESRPSGGRARRGHGALAAGAGPARAADPPPRRALPVVRPAGRRRRRPAWRCRSGCCWPAPAGALAVVAWRLAATSSTPDPEATSRRRWPRSRPAPRGSAPTSPLCSSCAGGWRRRGPRPRRAAGWRRLPALVARAGRGSAEALGGAGTEARSPAMPPAAHGGARAGGRPASPAALAALGRLDRREPAARPSAAGRVQGGPGDGRRLRRRRPRARRYPGHRGGGPGGTRAGSGADTARGAVSRRAGAAGGARARAAARRSRGRPPASGRRRDGAPERAAAAPVRPRARARLPRRTSRRAR